MRLLLDGTYSLVIFLTGRTRETNGKSEEVFFFVVKFHTKYLHLIEELIKEHKLEYKAKTGTSRSKYSLNFSGISNIIIYPPFCIAYTPRLREALNYGSELSRVFITICFVSAILQWLVECKPAPGTEVLKLRLTDPGETECTTMVGHVYSVMQAIGDYAIGVVVPIALAIYETVDSYVPILKYILVIPAWFILIPFSGVIALFSAIWYCSRFTLMIHALMAAIDELSLLTTNYKMLTSVLGAFVNLAHFIWTVVFKVYLKLFKTNNKAPTKGIKPKTE